MVCTSYYIFPPWDIRDTFQWNFVSNVFFIQIAKEFFVGVQFANSTTSGNDFEGNNQQAIYLNQWRHSSLVYVCYEREDELNTMPINTGSMFNSLRPSDAYMRQ